MIGHYTESYKQQGSVSLQRLLLRIRKSRTGYDKCLNIHLYSHSILFHYSLLLEKICALKLIFSGKDIGLQKKKDQRRDLSQSSFQFFWYFSTYGNFIELAVISKSPLSINSNISMKLCLLAKAKELRYASQEEGRVWSKLPFSHFELFNPLSMPSAQVWFPLTFCPGHPFCIEFLLILQGHLKLLLLLLFDVCVGDVPQSSKEKLTFLFHAYVNSLYHHYNHPPLEFRVLL